MQSLFAGIYAHDCNNFGSPYLAELFLVLGHFLQHLGQVPHGGL